MTANEILVLLQKSLTDLPEKVFDDHALRLIYATLQYAHGLRGISGMSVARKIIRESDGDILAMACMVSERITPIA